ncbi:MAG: AraC family transcriptional regulator [Bacteroidaceae bacterium]|nr:AraC family transcriptional regulator [Bacteroidaceae bacterium]
MTELKTLDFSSFPIDEDCAKIDGKLYLMDNLTRHRYGSTTMKAPVRLTMTIVMVATGGYTRMRINLHEYVIREKMVATMTAGSFMQIMETSPDFSGFIIAIAKDFFDYSHKIMIGMAMLHRNNDVPVAELSHDNYLDATEIYAILKRKLLQPDFKYKEEVARMYLGLFHYNGLQAMEEHIDKEKPLIANRKDDLSAQFLQLVKEHYRKERTISFYSTRLGVTPKYLSAVVKDVTGKFASDWINEYVILESKALLKNSNISIKQLSNELNFGSTSIFTKYFKQHTGSTPMEYRKM